ncbi:MAG TPA: putative glycoside hydrolase [Candidatus Angelobacter sp.]|nr:putative glycoside hydrolase [Candidatus Angelobacter sp.]
MPSRKYRLVVSAITVIMALGLGAYLFTRRAAAVSQNNSTPRQGSAAVPASDNGAPAQQLPPGTITYRPKASTLAVLVARKYLAQSSYITVPEFEAAIRKANDGKSTFKKDEEILIPGIEPQPVVEKSRPFPKDDEVRAVYMTGATAGSVRGVDLIRRWKQAGGNSVVFDIKDSDGSVNVPFAHPLAPSRKNYPISNLPKFVRFLHSLDMHAIARIALFRDDNVAQHHSTLAVQSRKTHEPWREKGKLVWTDPSRREVQDYELALAKYTAESGADEIQFDYVRFPAEGDQKDALFAYQSDPKMHRDDVIAGFLHRAYDQLHPMGVLLSLDVFGIMAWQRSVDLNHTGQDIVKMAQYCDVLSPMIYPSHFFGMDGYKLPGDAPEHFISISMDRFEKITTGSGVVLRPWLQAFHWKTKTYSPEYILKQVSTSKQHGGTGFLFWNAANDYSKPFAAMPTMMTHPAAYLKVAAAVATAGEAPQSKPDAPATK